MTTTIDRNEIDELKRVDIRIFLAGLGWQPDPADRYKRATFTRDKATVKAFQTGSGQWIARDFDACKSYSALDLAFEEVGAGQWKAACDLLRGIIGKTSYDQPATSPYQPAQSPQSSPDQSSAKIKKPPAEVKSEYETGSAIWRHGDPVPHYLVSRGITSLAPVFDGSFRVSDRGTLRFPHRHIADGKLSLGGVERRGPGIKGLYTSGGSNGVWMTPRFPASGVVVVCESQIDAMSYDLMRQSDDDLMYMSIRAGAEHIAAELLCRYIEMEKIAEVVVATDNDHAGLTYAGRILSGLIIGRREGEKYYRGVRAHYVVPPGCHEDWNDALRALAADADDPAPDF